MHHHCLARRLVCLALICALGVLAGCGDKAADEGTRERDAMPFVKIKLKNMTPNRPASATARGTKNGAPKVEHRAGPTSPGQPEAESAPPGSQACDGVTVEVAFAAAPGAPPITLRGVGNYPGGYIGMVDITCSETGGAAIVNFANGQPAETIQLSP